MFNINASDMIENVIAHEDDTSIWSMCLFPDKVSFLILFKRLVFDKMV